MLRNASTVCWSYCPPKGDSDKERVRLMKLLLLFFQQGGDCEVLGLFQMVSEAQGLVCYLPRIF